MGFFPRKAGRFHTCSHSARPERIAVASGVAVAKASESFVAAVCFGEEQFTPGHSLINAEQKADLSFFSSALTSCQDFKFKDPNEWLPEVVFQSKLLDQNMQS